MLDPGGRLTESIDELRRGEARRCVGDIETLDGEGRRLLLGPVDVVLADRRHDRAVRDPQRSRFRPVAAEDQFELIARRDAEIGGGVLGERAPSLLMHESGAQGEDEILRTMHAPADPIPPGRIDAGVPIHVVGVRSTPLRDQIVLTHEERVLRVGMSDRPSEPAQQLIGEVRETLDPIGLGRWERRCEEFLTHRLESPTHVAPGPQLGRFRWTLAHQVNSYCEGSTARVQRQYCGIGHGDRVKMRPSAFLKCECFTDGCAQTICAISDW